MQTLAYQDLKNSVEDLSAKAREVCKANRSFADALTEFEPSHGYTNGVAEGSISRGLEGATENALTRLVNDASGAGEFPRELQPVGEAGRFKCPRVDVARDFTVDVDAVTAELLDAVGEDLGYSAAMRHCAWHLGLGLKGANVQPGRGITVTLSKYQMDTFANALIVVSKVHDLPLSVDQLRSLARHAGYDFGALGKMASREKVALGDGIVLTNFKETVRLSLPADWVAPIQLVLSQYGSERLREIMNEAA
ncbi:MAG: hypothetical protein LAT62_14910 [Natronospirillum sp.]|uniref:hypothetical protein n=1 Tax=Natronospirillum sp. TaxID=2812955 RepID=UPI0025EAD30F|nr:hypothetical protein [Natronospirillum sp.]MCH8553226.1 hypothetical protein [Natronospirillum sp.]